jgi:hypothetical protein
MRIIITKVRVCLILVLPLLVFFTACISEYIPNMVNTPMFSNKGEFQATIAYGSDFNAQLGYAITDYIAVMVNGSYINNVEEIHDDGYNENQENYRRNYFIEGGIGYYNLSPSNIHYDVFCGYGTGKVDIHQSSTGFMDFEPSGTVDNTFNRCFFQPSIGLKGKVFEGNFSTRIAFVQLIPGERILTESWNFLLEPAITAKIGFKHLKGVIQIGYSLPLIGDLVNETPLDNSVYETNSRLFINIGLNLNIGRK